MFVCDESLKPTLLYKLDEEIIYDVLVDMADIDYNFTSTRIQFLTLNSKIDIIMAMNNNELSIKDFNAQEIANVLPYWNNDNTAPKELLINNEKMFFLKFNLKSLLRLIVFYLSGSSEYGGYAAKFDFVIDNEKNIIFIGIFGDIKNKELIKNYNISNMSIPIGSWGVKIDI